MADALTKMLGGAIAATPAQAERHRMHLPALIRGGPEALSFVLYQSVGTRLSAGNAVELVENGAIFNRMVEEIHRAQRSVHILVFIWHHSRVSDRLVDALLERAAAGVTCRVVVDPVGSDTLFKRTDFDEYVEPRLVRGGVEVHYYRPLEGRIRGRLLGRDHEKICVVDGRVAFTGGFGVSQEWEGGGHTPQEWRDTNIRVEGAAVETLQLAFARAWQVAGGALLPPEEFSIPPPAGDAEACFVASAGAMGITDAERMSRIVIACAARRLWIANAYFTPPDAILGQLEDKRARGVDVRVLAPGDHDDARLVLAAQRAVYDRLLRAGVRIFEYGPSMMHAKTMVVDDWLCMVGSTNLDSLSLNKLGEGSLIVADRPLAARMVESFERDLAVSREVRLEDGPFRTPLRRLARRFTTWLGRNR